MIDEVRYEDGMKVWVTWAERRDMMVLGFRFGFT